ncbi:DgyrCDS4048 [Dimorphilus gyrociliatus]|nr:DgyrCDS4048 [Dimorphilus gyrociliatus]
MEQILTVLYNCARFTECKMLLKCHNSVDILFKYTKIKNSDLKLLAVLFLANIVDENQSELFQQETSGIKYLIITFIQTIKSKSKRFGGWSAEELAQGISKLAINDKNKKLLVENGTLPPLYKLIDIGDDDEINVSCQAIWNLAFEAENKEIIFKNKSLMDTIRKLSQSNKAYQKAAQGIIFLYEEYEDSKKSKDQRKSSIVNSDTGHIMISYQWGNQNVLKQLSGFLKKHDYKIWMDIENMGGSTLQAMAEAVEQSSIILLCISEKYKESPNCRMEAEYALRRNKRFIPLLMERGYQPDGWLGIMVGTRLYYDFSGKYAFDEKATELVRELGNEGKASTKNSNHIMKQINSSSTTAAPPYISNAPVVRANQMPSLKSWNKQDLENWINSNNLQKFFTSATMSVEKLIFLQSLKREAPEFFYKTVKDEYKMKGIDDIMLFSDSFKKLP